MEPRLLIEEERPSSILVIRTDGTEVEVPAPVIRSDSITSGVPCERAFTPDGRADCRTPPPMVALTDVRSVEVQRTDPVRTLGAILVAPAICLGAGILLCSVGDGCY